MSDEKIDTVELAKKILDLWQDHLTAVAANPDMNKEFGRLIAFWTQITSKPSSGAPTDGFSLPPFPFATAWPQTVSGASDNRNTLMEQFGHRLAAIEERLARIEKLVATSAAKPARRRKPRP